MNARTAMAAMNPPPDLAPEQATAMVERWILSRAAELVALLSAGAPRLLIFAQSSCDICPKVRCRRRDPHMGHYELGYDLLLRGIREKVVHELFTRENRLRIDDRTHQPTGKQIRRRSTTTTSFAKDEASECGLQLALDTFRSRPAR